MNPFHQEILEVIEETSGEPTQHTFLNSYLGNSHPRYPISIPKLRNIAKTWMREHKNLSTHEFLEMMTTLIEGLSSTEKIMVGILMDYATEAQRNFSPKVFDSWLNHVEGWAEVDALCTGHFTIVQIPTNWKKWEPLLTRFSKSKNINKRRASLVLLCLPLRNITNADIAETALKNIDRLKSEKHVLITKAIS